MRRSKGGGEDRRGSERPREEEGPVEENKKATAQGRRARRRAVKRSLREEDRGPFRDYLP